jgi:hypothetical protein
VGTNIAKSDINYRRKSNRKRYDAENNERVVNKLHLRQVASSLAKVEKGEVLLLTVEVSGVALVEQETLFEDLLYRHGNLEVVEF